MNLREASKAVWVANDAPTIPQIDCGSLQRIADATEKMVANYDAVRIDRDYWKARAEREQKTAERYARSNNSLRGVITKLKRKAGAA